MKRILHALAALWPEKTGDRRRKTEEDRTWKTGDRLKTEDRGKTGGRSRKTEEDRSWKTKEWGLSHEGLWLPEARNGLLRHLSAMMRMGETVRELAIRECAHVPSRESAKRQPSESANLQISSTNQQIDEPTPKNTDNHLPKRVILSEREQPAERIGEPLPIAQVLARLYLRDAPLCAMGDADAKDGRAKQPDSASSVSSKPNSQPLSLAPRRAVPLALGVLALFMCLLSAQQVSAQAEPAAAAVMEIPEGGVVLGDTLPDWFWELRLDVVNHPSGLKTISLSECKDRLLVLDFWATYCKGCVASLDKWNALLPQFGDEVQVVALHVFDFGHKIAPFLDRREWDMAIAYGDENLLLNTLFFAHKRFGQVWIKGGKLFAIPKNSEVSADLVANVVANRTVDIEMEEYLTYFDKRNSAEEANAVPMETNNKAL